MIKIITLAALLLVLAACNEKNSSNDKNANDITSKAKEVVGRKNFGTKFPVMTPQPCIMIATYDENQVPDDGDGGMGGTV